MTEHDNLAQALLAVQAAAPRLQTNDTATVSTKGGGSYSYKYLTLDKLMADILPVLHEHGLTWFTQPSGTASEPTLVYALTHAATGEVLKGEMPLYLGGQQTAQAHGSAITYARRYALMAVLGLCAEDDDGKGASGRPRQQTVRNGNGGLSPDQLDELKAAASGLTGSKIMTALTACGVEHPQPDEHVFTHVTGARFESLRDTLVEIPR